MVEHEFQINTVTHVLAEGVELIEALGFPEISALGDTEKRSRTALEAKAKTVLEDFALSPALSIYRRQLAASPELCEVELTLEPAKRSVDWQEPVVLRLPLVRWVEESDLHQAFVPALGILVFAPRESLLMDRVKAHI